VLRYFFLFGIFALGFGALSHAFRPKDRLPGLPPVMLWSWDHSDDLRFISPKTTGVAFLERTVWLSPKGIESRPRLGSLRFPEHTARMAVVRFESQGDGLPERAGVIRELISAAETPGIRALQIDFDARQSERVWYRDLLRELRNKLPESLPLTITALASWCDRDDWIRGLPVADASPMFFRMGAGVRPPQGDVRVPLCQGSVGISTDELPTRLPPGRRVFLFHPGRWTPAAYEAALAQARRWQ
jgi:hypothetical protein